MDPKEQQKLCAKMVARAWSDPEFKKRLIATPAAALTEAGIAPPPGIEVKVVENTGKVFYMVLPEKPSANELSAEDLDKMAGGILPTERSTYNVYC